MPTPVFSPALPASLRARYDVIFAGGGTAACVTAGRLAAADPNLQILILESGPSTKDKAEHIQPGQAITHLAPTSQTMQFYKSRPSQSLAGRSVIVPSAQCVGGGSSINFALYNRPAASDLDAWGQLGNPGWYSTDLIPLFQKAETYEIDLNKPTHGSNGPLKVSFGGPGALMDIGKQFLDVGPKFEQSRPLSNEGNGFNEESINVFYNMPKWISQSGRRSDVAHHYVYNKGLDNLTVLDNCLVKRIIINNTGRATGVEYIFNKSVHPSSTDDILTVQAARLVVIAAGAMGSPLILERSGIGSKDVLEKANIPIIHELPGVGADYQDHPFYVTPYIVDPNTDTYDPLYRRDTELWPKLVAQWERDGSGRMSGNGVDGVIKMRPLPEELEELGPEFTEHFRTAYANNPDKPLFWLCASAGLGGDQSQLPHLNYSCLCIVLGYPESKGSLHITSEDPYAPPNFDSGFLTKFVDVAALRWGYKKGRELVRRLPVHVGALTPAHPQFSPDSLATLTDVGPVAIDAPKIVYSKEDDAAIDQNIRQFVQTSWHSLGTCPMKPLAMGGVVDSNLNVYGIQGLKIADLSIAPSNVNSNTNSVAVVIGEKAAVIIAEELGIKGV
ncbi:GMC oxidoreductase-domain-containing protein [Lentinula edodes]|nr:GMC oxidoreductase-domain-containing protein [Lentinula edodes]